MSRSAVFEQPGRRIALISLVAACLVQQALAQSDILVLRRDWTPTSCIGGACTPYPDSFSVDALYIASDGSTEPNTNCGGAQAALEPADLEAAGISRQNLSCAWQNYDATTDSLEDAWEFQWTERGTCTSLGNAAAYLRLGMRLDQLYPLPQNLPAAVNGTQLAAAIQAAFSVTPFITCINGLLSKIHLCFDPDTNAPVNCTWSPFPECAGDLALPRGGRGDVDCAAYHLPSPVLYPPPAASPPLQAGVPPAAAPALTPLPPAAAPALAPLPPAAAPALAPLLPAVAPATAPLPAPVPVASPAPAPALQPPPQPPPPSPAPPPSPSPPPPSPPPPSPPPPSPSPQLAPPPQQEVAAPAPAPAANPSPSPPPPSPPPPSPQPPSPSPPVNEGVPAPAPSPSPDGGGASANLDGSEQSSSSGGGGTDTASMAAALGGGIAGGIVVGLAVFGTAYWFYTRRGGTAAAAAAAGSGGSAGPGSGGKVVDGAQWGHGPVEEASLMPGTQQQPRAGGSWV